MTTMNYLIPSSEKTKQKKTEPNPLTLNTLPYQTGFKTNTWFFADAETTGTDTYRNEIISLSISLCDKQGEVDSLELKFRPSTQFWDDEAAAVHGFSKFEAARFPEREKSTKELAQFLMKAPHSVFVCHALWFGKYFDHSFLLAHFDKLDRKHFLYRHFHHAESTLTWFKYLHRLGIESCESFNLEYLCKKYGIPLSHHDATSDRKACQELYFKMMKNFHKLPPEETNGVYQSLKS